MKVFIVDDSPIVRDRLMTMFSEVEGIEVIGQAENAVEATERIVALRPDAVVMDIRLASGNGIDVLRSIKKDRPDIEVIMLTLYPYPQYRESCMKAGASFFLDKSTGFEKITEALKTCKSKREALKPIS
ncbi:MAG TPA: response regulator transcription factor [Candidatus Binatia bacterium]|jgi:DNA-binding NarL/FixJ family response regulator